MYKRLVVGNWKMNPQSLKEAENILKEISVIVKDVKNVDIVICPPFSFLSIFKILKNKKIIRGAQNVSSEQDGPYTGEVSAKMLSSLGISYVIIGHSERRAIGESNQIINKKILNSLRSKLLPILCVGESNRDNGGEYLSFIKQQINECLNNISKSQIKNIAIAYEPIWAIGEKALREATTEEFTEIKIFIRKILTDMYGFKIAQEIKILYGGSVHPDNAKSFLLNGGADGFLIGRDSLVSRKFGLILETTK